MFYCQDEDDTKVTDAKVEEEKEKTVSSGNAEDSKKYAGSIDGNGIHIEDDGDKVDIDSTGIHFTSKSGKKHDILSADKNSLVFNFDGNDEDEEEDDDDEDDDDDDDDDEDDDKSDPDSVFIAGSGKVSSGAHGPIGISGSGRFQGPLHCKKLNVSGSMKGDGDIEAEQSIRVSGSFRSEGKLSAKEKIEVAGHMSAASLKADRIKVSGSLELSGDAEADSVAEICGRAEIKGLLNAEKVDLHVGQEEGMMKIGSIGGTDIRVQEDRSPSGSITFGRFFVRINRSKDKSPAVKDTVVVNTIEGDTVELEGVKADVVRGKDVTIHGGCTIQRVEYSGSILVENGSTVLEKVKI